MLFYIAVGLFIYTTILCYFIKVGVVVMALLAVASCKRVINTFIKFFRCRHYNPSHIWRLTRQPLGEASEWHWRWVTTFPRMSAYLKVSVWTFVDPMFCLRCRRICVDIACFLSWRIIVFCYPISGQCACEYLYVYFWVLVIKIFNLLCHIGMLTSHKSIVVALAIVVVYVIDDVVVVVTQRHWHCVPIRCQIDTNAVIPGYYFSVRNCWDYTKKKNDYLFYQIPYFTTLTVFCSNKYFD